MTNVSKERHYTLLTTALLYVKIVVRSAMENYPKLFHILYCPSKHFGTLKRLGNDGDLAQPKYLLRNILKNCEANQQIALEILFEFMFHSKTILKTQSHMENTLSELSMQKG